MKKHLVLVLFVFCATVLKSLSARAALTSAFDVNLGFSSINLKSANFSSNLASSSAIETNYLLKHETLSLAYVMSFYEMIQAQGKTMPMTRFSVGLRYYPTGFNGMRTILDQGVEAQVWRATPFLGLNMGLANISVDEFNASVVEISPRFGVELPITAHILGQAQLLLHSGSSTGSGQRSITYDGVSGFVGVIFLNR